MIDSTPPDLPLFVAEDLSKPENRANIWLIAAIGIEPFWTEFSRELGVSVSCVMEPRQWPGRRPDLTVFEGEKPIAIIECENFGVNRRQNEAFEANCFGLPLLTILGDGQPAADITWSRISAIALAARSQSQARQRVVLDLLVAAIRYAADLSPKSVMRRLSRPAELPNSAWLLTACAPLLALPNDAVCAHAAAVGSASIRLRKPKNLVNAGSNGIGMAMIQAGRPMTVFLPSPEHLKAHLDKSIWHWVEEWKAMLHSLVPGFIPDGRRLVTVPIDQGDVLKAELVADVFVTLVAILREESPANRVR